MPGMGPPPKAADQRARRNSTASTTRLPREGRAGAPPAWPLGADVVTAAKLATAEAKAVELEGKAAEDPKSGSIRYQLGKAQESAAVLRAVVAAQDGAEAALWADLWRLPQAVEWERCGWTREVALYVRHQVLAESGDMEAAKEARQRSDRLGLTPMAMLRLRWEIEAAPAEGAERAPKRREGRFAGLKVVADTPVAETG